MTCQAAESLLKVADCFFLVSDEVTKDLLLKILKIKRSNIISITHYSAYKPIALILIMCRLIFERFDTSISQYGVSTKLYATVTFFSGVKHRFGWSGPYSFFNTLSLVPGKVHKVQATKELMNEVLKKWAISSDEIFNNGRLKSKSVDNLNTHIVLGISSFEKEQHKRWPLDCYIQLCFLIMATYPAFKIILVGSMLERDYCQFLKNACASDLVLNECGHHSIAELCNRINSASLVIANCNAISHIAGWYEVPIIGIYGPTNPLLTGPLNGKFIPVVTKNACAPCYSFKNTSGCDRPTCMSSISVDDVFNNVKKILY